jgi:hypothetical protein
MIDISKAFSQSSEPVAHFFQQPGVGYYIPLYQREYSWEAENVEQLMEDIVNGVKSLVQEDEEARDRAIHFLGTVILFQESNPRLNIQPRDDRALPSRIDNVIDGQQRISTLAVLACVLLSQLSKLERKLPATPVFEPLLTDIRAKRDLLLEICSVDIRRGTPTRKPLILRGSVDGWTFDGSDAENYASGISAYLAATIRAHVNNKLYELAKPTDKRVLRNVREMDVWINRILDPLPSDSGDYPKATEILKCVPQEALWSYTRDDLAALIKPASQLRSKDEKTLNSLVQLFAFLHYFTDRCCFTVIKPVSEEWAFDMFQSLNASGTPLTAIETFKPLVVNYISQEQVGKLFKDTPTAEYFGRVDQLISDNGPTSKKNKVTDEFLTAFALAHDGHPLSTQFSLQRRYLNDRFKSCDGQAGREEFVHQMADLATYWEKVIAFEPSNDLAIEGLRDLDPQLKATASLGVLYLRDAGHKMATTVLSRFYAQILRGKVGAAKDFADAVRAVVAFYSLWRSAQSNSGLDDVYRRLLRSGDADIGVLPMSAVHADSALNVESLKKYLLKSLGDLKDRSLWLEKASTNLRYDMAKPVCKFALVVAAHDTIVDVSLPGLVKASHPGVHDALKPQNWASSDLKTLEHVAPLKGKGSWADDLYDSSERVQSVGNLTLLPGELNSSLGSQGWLVKHLYFRFLGESDAAKIADLENEAQSLGIQLNSNTVDLLRNASYKRHIEPLTAMNANEIWNRKLVDDRAKRIAEILWDRLIPWLT